MHVVYDPLQLSWDWSDIAMNYILIEVIECEIHTPEFFDSFDAAHAEMKARYEVCSAHGCGELNDDNAWCKNRNHDACDWRIFEVR